MPQFGVSLADDSRDIIYNRNMFIIQATAFPAELYITVEESFIGFVPDAADVEPRPLRSYFKVGGCVDVGATSSRQSICATDIWYFVNAKS